MNLEVGCHLNFQADVLTPMLLMLRSQSGSEQWISRETYLLEPNYRSTILAERRQKGAWNASLVNIPTIH